MSLIRRNMLFAQTGGGGKIDYIYAVQSNDTQAVDTEFKPTYLSKMVIEANLLTSDVWCGATRIYEKSKDSTSSWWGLGRTSNSSYCMLMCVGGATGNTIYSISNSVKNSYRTFTLDSKNKIGTVSDYGSQSMEISSAVTNFSATYNLYLFCLNQWGSVYTVGNNSANFKSIKIYDNDVLVRDYKPCIRKSDGICGLWDECGSISSLTGTSFYKSFTNYELTPIYS